MVTGDQKENNWLIEKANSTIHLPLTPAMQGFRALQGFSFEGRWKNDLADQKIRPFNDITLENGKIWAWFKLFKIINETVNADHKERRVYIFCWYYRPNQREIARLLSWDFLMENMLTIRSISSAFLMLHSMIKRGFTGFLHEIFNAENE